MEKVKNILEKQKETLNKLLDTQPKMVDKYNADHLWKKATEFNYALEKNGYLACLEDLEEAGIIELKNIDKNH